MSACNSEKNEEKNGKQLAHKTDIKGKDHSHVEPATKSDGPAGEAD